VRAVPKTKSIVTLEHTIAAIAARSRGVYWIEDGDGLALILTQGAISSQWHDPACRRPQCFQSESLSRGMMEGLWATGIG